MGLDREITGPVYLRRGSVFLFLAFQQPLLTFSKFLNLLISARHHLSRKKIDSFNFGEKFEGSERKNEYHINKYGDIRLF